MATTEEWQATLAGGDADLDLAQIPQGQANANGAEPTQSIANGAETIGPIVQAAVVAAKPSAVAGAFAQVEHQLLNRQLDRLQEMGIARTPELQTIYIQIEFETTFSIYSPASSLNSFCATVRDWVCETNSTA